MAILVGKRLGPHEILSAIGAGGMGQVYRARDTRLDRIVAIKVLTDPTADRPELRERFEREARAIASLNHPYICTLYDIGHQDHIDYLVMEYLEGETLAQRLAKGPLPLDQVLRYGIQIADALDKAHRQGVTHRDLKPANIMITKTGSKLLDFGLAKLREPKQAASISSMPTRADLTREGVIIGTLQYMAPEQLEGNEVDARTDLFAFGAVLYEMLTAKKAFEGKTDASLIGAILKDDPAPPSTLRPLMPPALDRVVTRCLVKDPDSRWQTAIDLLEELKWIAADAPSTTPQVAVSRARWRELAAWMVATVAILAVVALAVVTFRQTPPELPLVRFEFNTPPTADLTSFALSPDGRQLVFAAKADSGSKLWLRPLDQPTGQPLAGTDGGTYPFWAPDSRAIGFFADGKLKRLDLGGGLPRELADATAGRGGTWNSKGDIVFAPSMNGPLLRIAASGGSTAAIMQPEETHQSGYRWPHFLPDGRRFLFVAPVKPAAIYLGSLDGGAPMQVTSGNTAVAYALPGYLLSIDQGVLIARRFDPARGEIGDPIELAQPLLKTSDGSPPFTLSAAGILAYRAAAAKRRQLMWVDREGTVKGTAGPPDEVLNSPALAHDGKHAAVVRAVQNNSDIWLFDLVGQGSTQFTFDPASDSAPIWSPDASRIVFKSRRRGPTDLYQKPVSGGNEQLLLAAASPQQELMADDWSTDGRFLLYETKDEKTGYDLWALPMTGDPKPFSVVQSMFDEEDGQFSPDGKWVAYASNSSGHFEVYIEPFRRPGPKRLVSNGGGTAPRWSHDGRELFYIAEGGALMRVPIRTGDSQSLDAGAAVRLFTVPIYANGSGTIAARQQYAVAPDDQRFLINMTLDDAVASPPITVVLNWLEGLKFKK